MGYYCEKCLGKIKAKNKYKHFISESHIELDKCKHIVFSLKDIDINDIDEAFCLYTIEHNKKFDYYLVKCEFELIFNNYHYCPLVTSNLSDNKTMISWSIFLEKIFSDFKDKGYSLNHIAEMHIIAIANELEKTYDFDIKHSMCALEWKLNAMINKIKNLIDKFDRNWRPPLNRKFQSYRV